MAIAFELLMFAALLGAVDVGYYHELERRRPARAALAGQRRRAGAERAIASATIEAVKPGGSAYGGMR